LQSFEFRRQDRNRWGETMTKSELIPVLIATGRVLLGILFVAGGLRHVLLFSAIAADMKKMGFLLPRFLLASGTAFQIIAGTLLALGLFVVPAALGLIAFTIVASVMMLPFWSMQGSDRTWAYLNWFSNVGIVGGLLLAAAQALY
jgi:putative oxidoreductase